MESKINIIFIQGLPEGRDGLLLSFTVAELFLKFHD